MVKGKNYLTSEGSWASVRTDWRGLCPQWALRKKKNK